LMQASGSDHGGTASTAWTAKKAGLSRPDHHWP